MAHWDRFCERHVSNRSTSVKNFLEVDDFGKGLCLWNMMTCVREHVCQQCLFHTCSHTTLVLRVRRAQPPQHNKLPVTFIPGHPCCFGAVAEGRAGGLEQQVSARANVEASASPARMFLTAVPTGGKAACMDLPTPRCLGVRGGWG